MKCPECGFEFIDKTKRWICPDCLAQCETDICPACGSIRPKESGERDSDYIYPDFLPKPKKRYRWVIAALCLLLALSVCANIFLLSPDSFLPGSGEIIDKFMGIEGNDDVTEMQLNSYYLPAKIGETLSYGGYEYTVGGDTVWCKYNMTLVDTYRGDEAEQMIFEGSYTLGENEELYIAEFRLEMLEQHELVPVVILPTEFSALENQYTYFPAVSAKIESADTQLSFEKGEGRTLYSVFAVSKDAQPILCFRASSSYSSAYFSE